MGVKKLRTDSPAAVERGRKSEDNAWDALLNVDGVSFVERHSAFSTPDSEGKDYTCGFGRRDSSEEIILGVAVKSSLAEVKSEMEKHGFPPDLGKRIELAEQKGIIVINGSREQQKVVNDVTRIVEGVFSRKNKREGI